MAASWNYDNFVAKFPVFADPVAWPPAFLESCWDMACTFINIAECPCSTSGMKGPVVQNSLDLMTAHIATLLGSPTASSNDEGTGGGIVQSASIGAVSVSMLAPPAKDAWQWWMNQTPYGQMLLALFSIKSVGGFYVGGLPERLGFRKVGGVFW